MRKIFTIRNIDAQREHMWSARRIEEEVAACPRRRISRYFMEYLPKDEPILEAGCGLGAWVIYLGDRGYDIAGIDNDAQVIGRLKEWRPSLNVSAGDIRGLPYETGSLGAVISLGVMEHFEEGCDEAMRETCRVLRPGGLFFFTVPLNNIFRKLVAHPLRSALPAMERDPWGQHPFCGVPVYARGSGADARASWLYAVPDDMGRFFGEGDVLGDLGGFPATSRQGAL